nr:hypothetical protein [uncultured bacterium]
MSEDHASYLIGGAEGCPFCDVARDLVAWSAPRAIALWDKFPVSLGHALIVPSRHVESWADLTADEKGDITAGIDQVRALIDERYQPHAYNVGYNDGDAAGQTIKHFHVHVIPRYQGDVPDPRGGVRWVLPDRAAYWRTPDE